MHCCWFFFFLPHNIFSAFDSTNKNIALIFIVLGWQADFLGLRPKHIQVELPAWYYWRGRQKLCWVFFFVSLKLLLEFCWYRCTKSVGGSHSKIKQKKQYSKESLSVHQFVHLWFVIPISSWTVNLIYFTHGSSVAEDLSHVISWGSRLKHNGD